jgi:hypothetical protein
MFLGMGVWGCGWRRVRRGEVGGIMGELARCVDLCCGIESAATLFVRCLLLVSVLLFILCSLAPSPPLTNYETFLLINLMADPLPPPKIITQEQTPLRCGKCELKSSMKQERMRYEDLLEKKAHLDEHLEDLREEGGTVEEDGSARLLTVQQMEGSLPEIWETYRETEEMILAAEVEIEELKNAMERDSRSWEEVIWKRGGWHL